jgi:hypothetical protein
MGANAQTKVPTFAAAEVLTAANQNLLSNGIPVFSGTATRDAAFGGSGEKTLAEGQFAFLEDSDTTQFYTGSVWQSVGVSPGLVLVKSETVGSAVASVTVTSCFNATYDAYKIIATGVGASGNGNVTFELTGLNTGYTGNLMSANFASGVPASAGYNNIASVTHSGGTDSSAMHMNIDIDGPFLAKPTFINCKYVDNSFAGVTTVKQTSSTSATGFTITPAAGTLTGGTIRIYGYANS